MVKKSKKKSNKFSLLPDMCPQTNVDMSKEQGGNILHNNKFCIAKPLLKDSHLYTMFNRGVSSKKKHI